MSIEAMKQALNFILATGEHDPNCGAFDLDEEGRHCVCTCGLQKTIDALRTAIEEAEQERSSVKQEPVAWDSAFKEWAYKRGVWPRLTHEEIFKAGWDAAHTTPPAAQPAPVQEHEPENEPFVSLASVQSAEELRSVERVEPDFSNSETLLMEPWKNPLCPVAERLVMADGAVAFERKVNANLRERLAAQPAPVQEPVAWATMYRGRPSKFFQGDLKGFDDAEEQARTEIDRLNREYPKDKHLRCAKPLYTAPPNVATPLAAQREWIGLTSDDVERLVEQARQVPADVPCPDYNERLLALADAKLRENNTP
jgi:hypothetical protein